MFARTTPIAFISLILTISSGVHAQSAYVNTKEGIYQLTGGAGNCDRVLISNGCGVDNNILSIAIYKDIVYYNTWLGDLKRFTIGAPGTCETLLSGQVVFNSMTVDKNGIIYMASSILVRYDPHSKQLTNLGAIPFTSMGDLAFYKDKLLLAGYDSDDWSTGLFEIDINDPANSHLYMSTPPFFGLLSYPVTCSTNRYFGLFANYVGSTQLIELDLEHKTVLGVSCTMPLDILDAASSTETGQDSKVVVTDMTITKSCQSPTGSIQINADYPGIGDVSFTLDNALTNTTGSFANVGAGVHHLRATAPGGGCFVDTSFTIQPAFDLVTNIFKTNPDNCANIAGSITINASAANGALTFAMVNNGTSQSTGFFNNLRGGLYKFRISNSSNCFVDTSVTLVENIPIGRCNDIFIPNAFTPNNDGKNDLFTVSLSSAFRNVSLQIFDRWGNRVYQGLGNTISWDGSYRGMQQPVGIYVYNLVLTDPNGQQKNMKGSLTLIR